MSILQEGDPFPEWPEDADLPEGEAEFSFRIAAAETIRSKGNELFKQVIPGMHALKGMLLLL